MEESEFGSRQTVASCNLVVGLTEEMSTSATNIIDVHGLGFPTHMVVLAEQSCIQ